MTKQKTSGAFKAIKIISIVLTCSTLFIALMLVALLDSKMYIFYKEYSRYAKG